MFLSKLFDRLSKDKITYCVLRNYEQLPEEIGNDLDIWIKNGDQEKFQKILFEVARDFHWTIIKYVPRFGFKLDTFFANEEPSLNIIHIDCWWFFYWRNVSFIDDRSFCDHIAMFKQGFYIPSPGLEASILLLQNLLYQGKVKEKYKKRIIDSLKKNADGFLNASNKPFGADIANSIYTLAVEGKWDELEKKCNFFRFTIIKRALFHKPFLQFKYWAIYIYGHLKEFLCPHWGMFLVLIGPDGSGKSTTSNNLIESEIKKLFQKKIYFHGHFPFLPELKKLAGFFNMKKKEVKSPTPDDSGAMLKPFGVLRSTIYPLYYGLNYFLGHILIWKERARGGLIIFDRYFYDYMIQQPYKNCPRWLLKIIAQIIPKPDILIFLKNNPETVHGRKPELPIEEVKRQSKTCENIINNYKNGFMVETSVSPEEVATKIQRIIINKIRGKQKIGIG